MRHSSLGAGVFGILALIAASSRVHADPPAAAGPSQVTMVNLISGAPAISISTRSGRNAPPAVVHASIPALGRAASAMPSGFAQLIVQRAGAPANSAPFGAPQPILIPAGARVLNLLLGTDGLETVGRIDLSRTGTPASGAGLMRFFNAVRNAESVDLCTPGASASAPGTVLWMNTGPETSAALPSTSGGAPIEQVRVSLGAQRWQLRAWANPPCSGRVLGAGEVTVAASASLVVAVATGDASGTAPLSMYLCPEATGDCQRFALAR